MVHYNYKTLIRGYKHYELSNHLGNVLTVISDKRITLCSSSVVSGYEADVVSASDYYAFGMLMPGRSFSSPAYRFGFNGQEKDNEIKEDGNSLEFKFRIYDTRLGRFLSIDPLTPEYPWNSPYAFAENDIIRAKDLEGKEKQIVVYQMTKDGSVAQLQVIDNKTLKDSHGPLGNGVYSITYSADGKTFSEAYSAADGDPNGSFASTGVKTSDWDPNERLQARIIVESVKKGLEDLGYSKEDVDKDVTFVDPSNKTLKTKYAQLNNAEKYTNGWPKAIDSKNGNTSGAQSPEVNKTGYSLKYYKDRGGVIGFIKSNIFKHINEAAHELSEKVFGDFNKMHEYNSEDFLRQETKEPQKPTK